MGIYDLINYGVDSSSETILPQLYGTAGTATNEMFVEAHPIYANNKCVLGISASKPDQEQWCGLSLYRSYVTAGTFNKIDAASFSGITGVVVEVGEDSDGDKYIDVQLTYDYTFSSATSLDTLLVSSKQNLCVCQGSYGDIYFRFQNCELIGTMKWRLSKLIFDCTGQTVLNSYGSVATPDKFCFYTQTQFFRTLDESDKHSTLFFKLPSFNFKGEEQSLADVLEKSKAIAALVDIPLSPHNATINGIGVGSSNSIIVNAGQVDLTFCSRNRRALNFNTYNVDVPEDIDFSEFQIIITKSDDTVLRTVTQATKSYSYTEAQQTTDGGPFATYKFKIYQKNVSEISPVYTVTVNLV